MSCPRADPSRPSGPRVYNYLTGGTDWFPADRAHAEELIAADPGQCPDFRELARQNRRFILAATTWAAGQLGIRQFLDVGSGLPAVPAVHDAAPDAVVAYVDLDPVCTMKMRAHYEDADRLAVAKADARDPGAVLRHPAVRGLLDLAEPVAVLLGGTLSAMEGDVARRCVAGFARGLAAGSAFAVSCVSFADPETGGKMAAVLSAAGDWHNHSADVIAGFFGSLGVRGGLADLRLWPRLLPVQDKGVRLLGGVAVKQLGPDDRHQRAAAGYPLRRDAGRAGHAYGTGCRERGHGRDGEGSRQAVDCVADDAQPRLGQDQGVDVAVAPGRGMPEQPARLGYLGAVPGHQLPQIRQSRRGWFRG